MVKRILLALTFFAALGAGGLSMGSKAEAHGCHSYGYRSYYPAHYGYGYGPRVSYYRGYDYPRRYYGRDFHGHSHHHHDRDGVYFSIGF